MSIVRLARARSGRRGGPGRGAFGDTVSTTVQLTPVDQLALQVNRFGPDAPAAYQFHATAFATGNTLDLDLASTAMLIYQRRAMDSFAKFQDAASSQLIARANLGMADPVTWVNANIAEVIAVLKGYGDSVGLPGAAGSIVGQLLNSNPLGVPLGIWIAGGIGAVFLLTGKRKGR